MLMMERNVVDVLHQEVSVSFVDMIQGQAQQLNFKDGLDEGLEDWILGRIQGIENIDQAIRTALDVIGGFDQEIKREEDEVELLLPPTHSDWQKAVTAAYVSTTVEGRYQLCLSILALLFYLANDLLWDQSLLAETFAVFRGVTILRFISRQTAKELNDAKSTSDSTAPDDVVARLRNLQVSGGRRPTTPTYSLVHRLLAQSGGTYELPGAAHRFLDDTGILQSSSPAHVTKFEVMFCDRLRLLGYHHAAQEVLGWLPRTPGVSYVLGRLWLSTGRPDDASSLFEKLAGTFGEDRQV
jgi:nuclear pore complex protein Nup160